LIVKILLAKTRKYDDVEEKQKLNLKTESLRWDKPLSIMLI